MKLKALLYCTKAKPYLKSHSEYEYNEKGAIPETRKRVFTLWQDKCDYYNGKIVIECDFEVEEIYCDTTDNGVRKDYHYYLENGDVFYMESGMTDFDLLRYLRYKNGGENVGYAIHIKNLHVFDKPRWLDEVYYKSVYSWGITYEIGYHRMYKAPQNMRYVYNKDGKEKKIIIPVSSQEMCRIANREQTVLVRKKVLKEML